MPVSLEELQRPSVLDLQRTGKLATIKGAPTEACPSGEMQVWIQKVNSDDSDDAYRRANAARVRKLQALENHDSDDYQALLVGFMDWNDDQLRAFLVEAEMSKNQDLIVAEFAYGEDSEWWDDESETSRIDGLIDAWIGPKGETGLREVYAADPEHKEAAECFAQIVAFETALQERLDEEEAELKNSHAMQPTGVLREEVAKLYCEVAANQAYRKTLDHALIWVCTRDPIERWRKHFATYEAVKDLDDDRRAQILREYADLEVGGIQGKEQPAVTSSSPEFESADPVVTGHSSYPKGATL